MSVNQSTQGVQGFFATHPVFTVAEFAKWHGSRRATRERTVEALLGYHTKCGHLAPIRKGLYAVAPPGSTASSAAIDPFLIAGKLTGDAVLAYHTALEFHGKAHTPTHEFLYLTNVGARTLEFRGQRFKAVRPPAALRLKRAELFGVLDAERMGLELRVTGLERTMVDVLARPHLGGGWEEIWRSLEGVEFFEIRVVTEYALLLGNATTIAKVGFFLEQHKEPLMVEDRHLDPLRRHSPRVPHYFSRGDRRSGKVVAGWNLVVPPEILERRWQEIP